jgi:hypothetical protein
MSWIVVILLILLLFQGFLSGCPKEDRFKLPTTNEIGDITDQQNNCKKNDLSTDPGLKSLFHIHNKLLHILKLLFNQSTINILHNDINDKKDDP